MYGIIVWYPMLSESDKRSLAVLQKRLLRAINNAPFRAHTGPLFKKCQILTISDQMKLENSKLIYRVLNNLIATPIKRFFIKCNSEPNYNTRNANVVVPKHSLSVVNRSFLCRPVVDWRSIKTDIKNSTSIGMFKNKMKK